MKTLSFLIGLLLAAAFVLGGCASRIPCTVNGDDAYCTVETDHSMTGLQYDGIRPMLDTIRGPEL